MKGIHMLAFLLLVVGGLNWLLVGVLGWDVGELFGGQQAMISRIIYILVGLAALWEVLTHKGACKYCQAVVKEEKPMPSEPAVETSGSSEGESM
ncbi:DUF378 domain-containing protein [Candidatus Parcubacteria bacterium]|nr:MAG: DUF378 domain-containing protein [Candidatus Parcubacteria bacterium]